MDLQYPDYFAERLMPRQPIWPVLSPCYKTGLSNPPPTLLMPISLNKTVHSVRRARGLGSASVEKKPPDLGMSTENHDQDTNKNAHGTLESWQRKYKKEIWIRMLRYRKGHACTAGKQQDLDWTRRNREEKVTRGNETPPRGKTFLRSVEHSWV